MLPSDGVWAGLSSADYGQKTVWWREGYVYNLEP
jgi:hypothetical protein